jgi:ABC-type nitrate/sulfonate/bicarbonate transport system substrate-binding protein
MCLECEHARKRAWYAAQDVKPHQREGVQAYYRNWYASNAESVKTRAVTWTKANPDKRRDVCRENMARQRQKLNNAYVRRMLAASIGLKAEAIPQSLVDAQRELLKIKRHLREHSI